MTENRAITADYEYLVDEEKGIAYLTVRGRLSIRDMENILRSLLQDDKVNTDLDTLTDFSDCTFTFQPNEMSSFFDIFNQGAERHKGRSAIVVSKPTETAIMMIHRQKVAHTRSIRVFSTREAALGWLIPEPGDSNSK